MTPAAARPRLLVNVAWPSAASAPVAVARTVIRAGGDGVGLPDSPRLFPDPFVQSERVLAATDVSFAGPCVLALGLRHPATVAAGLRTLGDSHGERVVGVLARGESGVRNEGLCPPSLREYLSGLERVIDVLGESARPDTLLGAASGPRTLAATGERLGGVLIDAGTDPAVVAAAIDAARNCGDDVRCWLFVRALSCADPDAARAATSTLLGSCAMRMAAAPDWYRVPEALRDDVAGLAAAHDYGVHGRHSSVVAGPAADLVRDRFFLAGPAADVTAGLRRLVALGIDGVILAGATGGLADHLGETVAAMRDGLIGDTPDVRRSAKEPR